MRHYSLAHLADATLDHDLEAAARSEHDATAWLLAHLAESDARRRYAVAGYRSMTEYCVRHLRFSEEAAGKRIRVARVARQFPGVFEAIAAGRVHMTAVLMLAPRLTPANAAELLEAATHRTKAEIELLLASRFPQPDVPERVEALSVQEVHGEPALERVEELSTATASPRSPARGITVVARGKVTPLSPQRYGYEFTGDQGFHDDLERFRALVGHEVDARGLVGLLHHALRLGLRAVERRKYGITDRPRTRSRRQSLNPRHVPAEVKRAVVARDGGRCTFTSESGRRCEARERLEFDHVEPVARGGRATVANLRLRCRAHNQFEAEQAFGAAYIEHRRTAAREAAAVRRRGREARAKAAEEAQARTAAEPAQPPAERARLDAERALAAEAERARARAIEEVIPWLRALRLRKDEARQAAVAACERAPDAPLEQRVRVALSSLAKAGPVRVTAVGPCAAQPTQ